MTTRTVACATVWVAMLALLGVSPGRAQEQKPPETEKIVTSGYFTLGGQGRALSGDKWSKFEMNRDVPRGFFLREFLLDVEKSGRPWFFSVEGEDAAERDRHFRFVAERFGKFRSELRWNEFPRFSSRLTQSFDVLQSDRYFVADPTQLLLETTPSASIPATVRALLVGTPFEDVRSRRRRFEYLQTITPTPYWRLQAGVMTEARTGFRPIGLGSYERISTPLGDRFRVLGDELPEPLDYRTTEFRASASYERSRGYLRFEYVFSNFENHIDTLTWDNPFRLNDAQANPGGGTGRWRFGTGRLDLWPDNRTNTISISGGVNLPHNTRLTGLTSLSWWRQNDPFVPFTSNTAVTASGCVAPFPPTCFPAGVTATDLGALPTTSLAGKVLVHNQDWAVHSRVSGALRVVARYRLYDFSNDSEEILFPGYVAFGDAFWLTNIDGEPIEANIHDYSRQQSDIEAIWRPRKEFSLKNEFGWEAWNRRDRQYARTNEWFWRTQLIFQPVKWFYAKANYRYGDRIPRGTYVPGAEEFSLARMFDQIHRVSHSPDVLLTFTPVDRLSLSASYAYRSQSFDDRFYGLTTQLWNNVTFDASYDVSESFSFFASYTRERYRATANEVGKTGSTNFNILNTFIRDTNDRLRSFDLGFDVTALEGKLNWNVAYGFALSRVFIQTFNPFPVEVQSTLVATAFPFPAITENYQDIRTVLGYKVRPNIELGVRYLLEPRILHDFTTDIMQPYMFGQLAPENDATRYLFLDARDASYHAHVASVFLTYTF